MVAEKYNIHALLLGCYFGLLPFLAIWHISNHSAEDYHKSENFDANLATENGLDCNLCMYYFDQWGYIQIAIIHQLLSFSISSVENLVSRFYTDPILQNHLRGPPIARSFL